MPKVCEGLRGEGEKERARCAVRIASLKTTTTHGSRSRPGSVNGDDGSDDSMYSASAEETIYDLGGGDRVDKENRKHLRKLSS